MPTIDPTASAAAAAPPTAGSSALMGLGGEDFLQLLVAQLRYQSPLAPSDPTALFQQTGQMAQVEMLQQVSAIQQQLLGLEQTAIASSLIGKEITATANDGSEIVGVVDAVRFSATGPVLVVGGTEVAVDRAREVRPSSASA